MSTTKILLNEINQCIIDIKSDKASIRQKGLCNIDDLLETRSDDVSRSLESDNDDLIVSWKNLFTELHHAVQDQCGRLDSTRNASNLNTLKNKNDAYKSVLTKCIDLANQHIMNVPLQTICEMAFECFGNETMRKHFDGCYLKIISKHILNTKFHLDGLEFSQWSQLLSFIFKLCGDQESGISKLELLQCIPLLLRQASRYTYLIGELPQYLPDLVVMVYDESQQYKAQKQVLCIIYEFIQCMALSQRKAMVEFSEQVLDRILKMYQFNLDDGVKEIMYKIFHLSIVIHSPQIDQTGVDYSQSDDLFAENVAHNVDQWHKQLRGMFSVVEREINGARKQSNRSVQKTSGICDTLAQMAAKLCSVIYWNESVWTKTVNDEQVQKRRRQTMKLERIMELIEYEPKKFCWRWFAILSELLVTFRHLLEAEDYQPLIKLIADYYQSTIQDAAHMKLFNNVVRVMLSAEVKLKATPSSPIRSSFCTEHWHKIMEFAFKQAATNKSPTENLELIGILVVHGIIVSHDFIKTIITDIIQMTSIRKSNDSIGLLINIFRSTNVDLIDGIYDLKISVITWLSTRIAVSKLMKAFLSTENNLDQKLIAELYVLCILSRQGQSNTFVNRFVNNNNNNWATIKESTYAEYRFGIRELEKNLQYRTLAKLIVCDLKKAPHDNKPNHTKLPHRHDVKAIINETFNAKMEESLHSDDRAHLYSDTMDQFPLICTSLETYLNVLNCLIQYEAMDAELLNASNLKKRIVILVAQMNDIVSKFDKKMNAQRSPEDVNSVVDQMLKVWNGDHHFAVANIIYAQDNEPIISWLLNQLIPSQLPASAVMAKLKNESEMSFAYQVQLKCLTLVAHFAAWDKIDSDNQAIEGIQDYEFEYKRNEDLFMVFELVKIIFNQASPTEVSVEWAFERLTEICNGFGKNQHLMDIVMEIVPAAIKCVKPYENLHDDLVQLLGVVLNQSRKRKYGQTIALKAIKSVQYFAKEFYLDEDCFIVCKVLKKFLTSEYLHLQLATVECLTNIFNKHWLCPDLDSVDCLKIQNFHTNLFDELDLMQMPSLKDGAVIVDRKTNVLSTYLQLSASIIGSCFVLRKKMWFQLIDLCCNRIELKAEKTHQFISKLCEEIFDAEPTTLLKSDIPFFIGRWIQQNFNLTSFPWQLTASKSRDDFVPDYIECITLNIILYQTNLLPQLVQTMAANSLSELLTKSVLIKCLAFSINASQSGSRERKDIGKKVIQTLGQEVSDLEQYIRTDSLQIMEEMLNTMCDPVKFVELFIMNVEHANDENAMEYECFVKSVEYIQKKCDRQQLSPLIYFSEHEPVAVINALYSLKLSIQQSVCDELKLYQLFRFCVLIDMLTEFLVQNAQSSSVHENCVAFFVKDFVYFFGNLISGSATAERIKLAACNYFYRFNQKILPKCAEHFQSHLNYVVSILMPMTKVKPSKIANKAMDLLIFLIVDQRDALHVYIGLLDSFPSTPEFDVLRQIQNDSKYDGKTFNLLDEIECFLAIDKRKTEGLLSLKEHLSSKKSELKKIYEHIYDSRGFSEDCDKSVIHRLIYTLLQTVQSVDKEKSILAAKCLGELGPSDLGTMCLRFDSQSQNYKDCSSFGDAVEHLCEFMLEKLHGLFAHSDANVLKATSTACQQLLRSQKVTTLLTKYPSLSIFKTTPTLALPFAQPKGPLNMSKWFDDTSLRSTHSIWIKNIAIELFTFFECEYLAELAAMQAQFSEAMVPLLVKIILKTGVSQYMEDINKSINIFFANHSTKQDVQPIVADNGQTNAAANLPVYMNKISIKLMLNVAECIRIHNQSLKTREFVTMNYLHIAKAAAFCHAHFTAILYGELLALDENKQTDVTVINSIMMNAYKAIGETDGISAFLDPIKDPIQYLISKQDWSRALNILDVSPAARDFSMYNQYLGQAGLYGLANKLSLATDSDPNYECAWRLGDWSIVNDGTSAQSADLQTNNFEKYHYFALKSFQQKDGIAVRFNIENGMNEIIKRLKQSSYECTKNIYKDLMRLHMLQQIEELSDVQFPNSDNVKQKSPEFIIQKWKYQDAVPSNEFICREQILAQRVVLFQSAGLRAQRKIENVFNLTNGIQQMILELAGECREEECFHMSQRYLASLREMNPSSDIMIKMMLENAKLSWDMGDHVLTKHLINVVKDKPIVSHVPIAALSMYGEYLAETQAENTKTIIEKYFKESHKWSKALKTKFERDANNSQGFKRDANQSIEVMEKFHSENQIRNFRAIAKYADREYQQIAAYKKSSDFEKKQQNVEKNLKILADTNSNSTKNEKKSRFMISKSVKIDEADIKSTNDEYDWYLETTVRAYLKCLALEKCDETDCFIMFRVFALLLANQTKANILESIKITSVHIPSFKFIEVIPQITAHLNTNDDALGSLIHDIVLKCAREHPHHVIIKLFALANAHIDSGHGIEIPSTSRTDASKTILMKLRTDKNTRLIVEQMEQMCTALINLANKEMAGERSLPSEEPLLKLRNLDKIHCPTVKLNVSPFGNYSHSVGITRWLTGLMRPGGINAPKRIECIGTDGKKYLQLLKGKDDPRQDAVMQQVFNIVNDMLNRSKVTKKDRLIIRTYAVVPLSQRSGILEWCSNTTTMSDYLIDTKQSVGAHVRYRPQDTRPSECRKLYAQVDRTHPFQHRYTNYMDICKQIQPVFHHFFFENFYNPGVWFERRMAYAHSLATTSMIGYILGIGDRHVNNILIDKTTAELIHIDFGVAFEQGKCLITPELIPFRLTRDLISALGPSKVEGVFKKTCEKTMQVLRQHKSTIMTVVEVLMHDPLNDWTLTSSEAAKRQQTDIQIDEQDVNSMAERALLRLGEKLDGKHVSRSDSLSVERHVELLIQEATDDKKLCCLYVGWQPYI